MLYATHRLLILGFRGKIMCKLWRIDTQNEVMIE